MSYLHTDNDLLQNHFVHKTPDKITRILYTESDVENRLDEGHSPLDISIEKWERILEAYEYISTRYSPTGFYKDLLSGLGHGTCALCVDSLARYEKEYGSAECNSDKCSMCPLSVKETCAHRNSTYAAIKDFLDTNKPAGLFGDPMHERDLLHEKLGEYIRRMVQMLYSLRHEKRSESALVN
ncbi:MAG: hypothetical protein GY754_39010 [bacterium]|nr:hypothetical protein [bacterium]